MLICIIVSPRAQHGVTFNSSFSQYSVVAFQLLSLSHVEHHVHTF